MMPSVGAKLGKSTKALANCSSRRPPASAISAETNVSVIAAAERNTSVSTIIATAMPISSPIGAWVCSAWSTTAPLRETSSPARSPTSEACSRRSPGSFPSAEAVPSYWTGTKAMRPSLESWPLPLANGPGAPVTRGWSRISATVRSIAARRSVSSSVPDSTAKTTLAVSPDTAGKRSSKRSIALCDSVPGVRTSSTNEPPPAPAATPNATSTAAKIASERFQCAAAEAARVPRKLAMPRIKAHSLQNCKQLCFAVHAPLHIVQPR